MYQAGELGSAEELLDICRECQTALTFDDLLLEPQFSMIDSRKSVDISTYVTPLRQIRIPIIASNMDTVCGEEMCVAMDKIGGIGFLHRYMSNEEQLEIVRKLDTRCTGPIAVAVGVKGVEAHITNLVEAGVAIIVLDVAHGHHKNVGDLLEYLKKQNYTCKRDNAPVEFIAGNVAIPLAVNYLGELGADGIRVGIGPGSLCTTRVVTGHGVPQLTSVAACSIAASRMNKTILADGGIRNSGDIVKALAAGANAVMCGSLLAGTTETPGKVFVNSYTGELYKPYRGMASYEAQSEFYNNDPKAPEGASYRVPFRGPVSDIIENLAAGIQSGLSYSGCMNIKEFQINASWVRTTLAGNTESKPHLMPA